MGAVVSVVPPPPPPGAPPPSGACAARGTVALARRTTVTRALRLHTPVGHDTLHCPPLKPGMQIMGVCNCVSGQTDTLGCMAQALATWSCAEWLIAEFVKAESLQDVARPPVRALPRSRHSAAHHPRPHHATAVRCAPCVPRLVPTFHGPGPRGSPRPAPRAPRPVPRALLLYCPNVPLPRAVRLVPPTPQRLRERVPAPTHRVLAPATGLAEQYSTQAMLSARGFLVRLQSAHAAAAVRGGSYTQHLAGDLWQLHGLQAQIVAKGLCDSVQVAVTNKSGITHCYKCEVALLV